MKILFLAHRIRHLPEKRRKIRACRELQFLSSRQTVDLLCFADSDAEAEKQKASTIVSTRRYFAVSAKALISSARNFNWYDKLNHLETNAAAYHGAYTWSLRGTAKPCPS